MAAARSLPRNSSSTQRDERRALGEIVEHRVQRRVDQPRAIVERLDADALREDRRIELVDTRSDRRQTVDGFSPFRIRTMPVATSSSSSCPTRPWRGTALTTTCATSPTRIGVPSREATTMSSMSLADRSRPMPRTRYCCCALLQVAPARVGVPAAKGGVQLSEREIVVAELREIRVHLVLLDESPEAHDVRDAGRQLEMARRSSSPGSCARSVGLIPSPRTR